MEQVASKVCRKIGGKNAKEENSKNGFLIVVGLLLVEFLLYFLLTNKWLLLAVIIALDIFLLVVIRLLIRDVEITNVEKIQEASSIAEQSLDYVVNEVPVGIITYNGETRAVEWLNPYAASIFNKDNQLTLTASQVTSYLELAERNQDILRLTKIPIALASIKNNIQLLLKISLKKVICIKKKSKCKRLLALCLSIIMMMSPIQWMRKKFLI